MKDNRTFVENCNHKDDPIPPMDAWYSCYKCNKQRKIMFSNIEKHENDHDLEILICEFCAHENLGDYDQ